MVRPVVRRSVFAAMFGMALLAASAAAQEPGAAYPRDTLLAAAREIIAAARYGTLITLDSTGHPQARAVDPFAPGEDFVVWIGTRRQTRKVREIQRDPRVTLYYFDGPSAAYVTIRGTARIVTDPAETGRRWKPEWDAFYPDRAEYVLVAVTPNRLELMSMKLGIGGDPVTWAPPAVEFPTR